MIFYYLCVQVDRTLINTITTHNILPIPFIIQRSKLQMKLRKRVKSHSNNVKSTYNTKELMESQYARLV